MKTIREWLEELPEPYKTQAKQNTKKLSVFKLEEPTLSDAVMSAFRWETTPEGLNYWMNLYDELELVDYWSNPFE